MISYISREEVSEILIFMDKEFNKTSDNFIFSPTALYNNLKSNNFTLGALEGEDEYVTIEVNFTYGGYLSYFRGYRFQVSLIIEGIGNQGCSEFTNGLKNYINMFRKIDFNLAKVFVKAQIIEALDSNDWNWIDISSQEDKLDNYIEEFLKHI